MRFTAQRVVRGNQEGINVFMYWHDDPGEDPLAMLDAEKVSLRAQAVVVEPGGNRIRSYLDVAVANHAKPIAMHRVLGPLLWPVFPTSSPMTVHEGDVAARFACEEALLPVWRDELLQLFFSTLDLAESEAGRASPRLGLSPR